VISAVIEHGRECPPGIWKRYRFSARPERLRTPSSAVLIFPNLSPSVIENGSTFVVKLCSRKAENSLKLCKMTTPFRAW
jgi:hypothetical protein